MKIDDLYINESKRIRKLYLDNLLNITLKEELVTKYSNEIQEIQTSIKEIDQSDLQNIVKKISEIDEKINSIRDEILPYYEKIQELDIDQRTLYNNIKDKYNDITDEEIKNQVLKYIKVIDDDFIKKNESFIRKKMEKK